MKKKNMIISGVILLVIVTIIAVPVINSKQEYKRLTQDSNITESQPSEEVYISSYMNKVYDSVMNPTTAPDELTIIDVPNEEGQVSVEVKENPVSSFETVKFSSVMTGRGIKAASDEEIANAGHYHVGDTVLDNAKYVLFHDSKYYDLVYTEVEWDGYTLQDVTLGKAHDTLEEAFKKAGVTPKGIPMYLPLNIGGIKTMAEFNEIADDVVLIVFDGAVYTKIPYSQLVQ